MNIAVEIHAPSSPQVSPSSIHFNLLFLSTFSPFLLPMNTPEFQPKRRTWTAYIPRHSIRPSSSSGTSAFRGLTPLTTTEEGVVSEDVVQSNTQSLVPSPETPAAISRTSTIDSYSLPSTPRRRSSSNLLTPPFQALDHEASQLILNALERTNSEQQALKAPEITTRTSSGSFSKMTFSSMMGGLSALSLSRTSTRDSPTPNNDDKEPRGRSMSFTSKDQRVKSSSQNPGPESDPSRSRSRARSQSPFSFRRLRHHRESSPTPQAIPLAHSDIDLSDSASSVRPRSTAFSDDHDSGDDTVGDETEDEDWSDDDLFDPVTERNTEHNAIIAPVPMEGGFHGLDGEVEADPDPLGEGVNVVVPPEPYFPSTLNSGGLQRGKRSSTRRKKSVRHHEPLPYRTSRPVFQRDRCTITITQGDPEATLGERRKRRYVVASDLSEESRYAVEWGIGTVLRDGDEMLIVTIVENEAKVDPQIPNAADRAVKLRSQQERQGLSYILVRQVTSLLQRTRLNVSVSCQAWHAKHARHMLLDIVDHNDPTMLIVGSRGMGQLKGILLGSTSHYLIEKCSVPVMVARRRLKRPPRRSAHLSTHRTHVSLAEAGIDRVAPKVDQDVKIMRDEIKRDDDRRDGGPGSRDNGSGAATMEEMEDGEDEEEEGADGEGESSQANGLGIKVAGED